MVAVTVMSAALAQDTVAVEAILPTDLPDPFRWTASVVERDGAGTLRLHVALPAGGAIRRDSLRVVPVRTDGVQLAEPVVPPGVEVERDDDVRVVLLVADSTVDVPFTCTGGAVDVALLVVHQGCQGGRCWPEARTWIEVEPCRGR